MSAFSDHLENALLNHVLRGEVYTPPTTLYVSLHTVAVGDDGLGEEVTGGSYERQTATFTLATASTSDNAEALVWLNMPSVTVVAVGIWDAITAGNLLFHGNLVASRTLSAGDPFTFNTGDLDITLD